MNTTLFRSVIFNKDLFKLITSFIKGIKYRNWYNGDLAIELGYYSLVREKIKNNELLVFTWKAIKHCYEINTDFYQWLIKTKSTEVHPYNLILKSIEFGDIEAYIWLTSNVCRCSTRHLEIAIKNQNLSMIHHILYESGVLSLKLDHVAYAIKCKAKKSADYLYDKLKPYARRRLVNLLKDDDFEWFSKKVAFYR